MPSSSPRSGCGEGACRSRYFGRSLLEVTAATDSIADQAVPDQQATSQATQDDALSAESQREPSPAFQDTLSALLHSNNPSESGVTNVRTPSPTTKSGPQSASQGPFRHLKNELLDLQQLLTSSLPDESQTAGSSFPAPLARACRLLVAQGLRPSTAESLCLALRRRLSQESLQSDSEIQDELHRLCVEQIRVSGPLLDAANDYKVAMFVGPSGAGKTTAIVKLAAHYRLQENRSVALITLDTCRMAAVEHLRMYAHVLGVPLETAQTTADVVEGIRRHRQASLIMIDTPGFGPHETAQLMNLGRTQRFVRIDRDASGLVRHHADAGSPAHRGTVRRLCSFSPALYQAGRDGGIRQSLRTGVPDHIAPVVLEQWPAGTGRFRAGGIGTVGRSVTRQGLSPFHTIRPLVIHWTRLGCVHGRNDATTSAVGRLRMKNMFSEQEAAMPTMAQGSPCTRVIAVTSGKGGVGKTNVVANLAVGLARAGKRVLVLDADLGLGNIDVLLGLVPRYTLEHVLCGSHHLSDIIIQGPAGIQVLPAGSGLPQLTSLTDSQQLILQTELEHVTDTVEVLLIDTGAGVSPNVTYFASAAQETIVVISPEPTSLTDAYALMKVLCRQHRERRFKVLVNMVKSQREAYSDIPQA